MFIKFRGSGCLVMETGHPNRRSKLVWVACMTHDSRSVSLMKQFTSYTFRYRNLAYTCSDPQQLAHMHSACVLSIPT